MPITKINDAELFNQERFHVNQSDVPGKTAQEMKEFMDYIPRHVIIPKVNELVDTANAAAPADSVYTKTETDGKLSLKADADSVYKKSDTYNKSEADGLLNTKANSVQVYTKAETDKKLADKADLSSVYIKPDVYSKSETNTLLAEKISEDSDRIIRDVTARPEDKDITLLCRDGQGLKLYRNGDTYPKDKDSADIFLSPAVCSYDTDSTFTAAIENHGLTDTNPTGSSGIHLLDVYTRQGGLISQLYITYSRKIYRLGCINGNTLDKSWSLSEWINGTADVCGYFAGKGYTNLIVKNISGFAQQVFVTKQTVYDGVASEKYVQDAVNNADTYTREQTDALVNTLDGKISQKLNADSEQIIIDTAEDPTEYVSSTILYRLNDTLKLRGRTFSGSITNGTRADECISPSLPCAFGNEAAAISAIEVHGLTDSCYGGMGIRLFDLSSDPEGSYIIDPIYIIKDYYGNYRIGNVDGNQSSNTWTLSQWLSGDIDLCAYFSYYGFSEMYVTNLSEFGKEALRTGTFIYSPVATEKYVQDMIQSLQNTVNELSAQISSL